MRIPYNRTIDAFYMEAWGRVHKKYEVYGKNCIFAVANGLLICLLLKYG